MNTTGTASTNEYIRYQFHQTKNGEINFLHQLGLLNQFPSPSEIDIQEVNLVVIDGELRPVVEKAHPDFVALPESAGIMQVRE